MHRSPITRTGFRPGKSTLWWLGTALVLGLIGWSKSINLLLLLGLAFIGLSVCQAWVARHMTAAAGMEVVPTASGFAGEAMAISLRIENRSRRYATFRIDGPGPSARFFHQFPPRQEHRSSTSLTFPKRGAHPTGAVVAVSAYPFGIVEHRRTLDCGAEITAFPRKGQIREKQFRHWLKRSGAGDHRRSRPALRRFPAEGDVRGIRPYRLGDNPRDVHWKTSARRDQLHVREYDRSSPQDLAIIVEAYSPSDGEYEPLEQALSLAATIAWEWSHGEAAARVTIAVLGASEAEGRGLQSYSRGLRTLALVKGDANPGGIDPHRSANALRHSHRVFVSSRNASPWPARFAAAGLSVLAIGPDCIPAWYRPPAAPL